ncbi:hypothetical protein LK540_03410 [Massilia sp. IC2-278]|uniref:hypothetical protein n=1 Tax=Massilia sp. IC2-278 TaxID=2887200 RepID=UPI001E40C0E3|nr:hypothetical protein [Massilia sp. IC2-278]MCC2959473.1 hypothetical protein [Massilia sp. IC2-278]
MNWDSDELRAAALRLLLLGTIRSTRVAEPLLVEAEELGLVVPARRLNEFRLPPHCKEKFRRYLKVRWPELDDSESAFCSCPDTISATALRTMRRMSLDLPVGIERLNRKTWSAWAGAHSKSGYRTPPEGVLLTTDEALRLRANAGLEFSGEGGERFAANACQALFGETIVPERGLARSWRLCGELPKLILTVENIGAYVDFSMPSWLLLIHAPGRNTLLATRFIDRLPSNIPWLHFGDVDPAGLDIGLSIHGQEPGRRPTPWIPRAASVLLATHSLPLDLPWPTRRFPPDLLNNPMLKWLIDHQRWLEHEAAVLLPGFRDELDQLGESFI